MVRTSDCQSRVLGFESSCCHLEAWALHWFSSFSCVNEYQVPGFRKWWVFVKKHYSHSNCSMAEWPIEVELVLEWKDLPGG